LCPFVFLTFDAALPFTIELSISYLVSGTAHPAYGFIEADPRHMQRMIFLPIKSGLNSFQCLTPNERIHPSACS
jgi:hypothetical protein